MATLTNGETATLSLDAFASVNVVAGAQCQGTMVWTSAMPSRVPSFTSKIQNKVYGPHGAPMTLVITVTAGSLTYTIDSETGGYVYDANGNIIGLVGADTSYPIASADVVVFGGTPAGIAAAVAAARQNKRVVLVSNSERLGGVLGWGINHTDVNVSFSPGTVVGFAKEFYTRLAAKETNAHTFRRYHRLICETKPSWVRRVINELIAAERNITVVYDANITSVSKTSTTIDSVTLDVNGGAMRLTADMFIDASYTGDLAAEAGCTISIGREANATYTETSNGIQAAAVWPGGATVDPYITAGVSGSGVLPFVDDSGHGTNGAADARVMLFTYRLYLTKIANGGTAFSTSAPTDYNALNYELLGRAMASAPTSFDTLAEVFSVYSAGLTSSSISIDLNSRTGLSSNYPNQTECKEYITATPARRAVIEANAKNYLLGLLYWISHSGDSRIPAGLVTELNAYGFDLTELGAYSGFSPQMYIRDGRRVVGDFVLKQTDFTLNNGFTDAIAFMFYELDSAMVRIENASGTAKTEGAILTAASATAAPQVGSPIPYRVLLPKVTETTNLLVPGAPSMSHVAWMTCRMEPMLMAFGQAAGIAAALAIDDGTTVANVSTTRLLRIQDITERWDGISLSTDGTDGNGTVALTGTTTTKTTSTGVFGFHPATTYREIAGSTAGSVKFSPLLADSGAYAVYVRYPPDAAGRDTAVPFSVVCNGVTYTVNLNQRYPGGSGGVWEYLGTFNFRAGISGADSLDYVIMDTGAGLTGTAAIAAVKWVRVNGWG